MGVYINPHNMSKEDWLKAFGEKLSGPPASIDERPGSLPVCLVDNGLFTAAGVAYSELELEVFTDLRDIRPKIWFWVDTDNLRQASNLSDYIGEAAS